MGLGSAFMAQVRTCLVFELSALSQGPGSEQGPELLAKLSDCAAQMTFGIIHFSGVQVTLAQAPSLMAWTRPDSGR